MGFLAERAIALIRKRGTARDNDLAAALGTGEWEIAAALTPHCASGELVCCRVNLGDKGDVNEYRPAGGGPPPGRARHPPTRPPRPEPDLAAAAAATVRAPHRTVPPQHNTEGATMSVFERILDAYKKHGPMTTRQLRAHVDVAWGSVACSQLAKAHKLIRLGGGAHSSIYGLPGQKLPKGDGAAVAEPKKAPKAKPKKRSAPVRKVQRKTAKKAQKTVSAAVPAARPAERHLRMAYADAGAFRTAIASDGAMIFLGAKAGAFELDRGETRAVIEFVRTLDRGEVGASPQGAQP